MSKQSEDTLKPCPFCGAEAEMHGGRECCWIFCNGCHATTTNFEHKKDAIAAWNHRTE